MRLIILGAGDHRKVVADLAEQTKKYEHIYFLDDAYNDSRVMGKCDDFNRFHNLDEEMYPVFGNNKERAEWEHKSENAEIKLAKIIYPLAYVNPKAFIFDGAICSYKYKHSISKGVFYVTEVAN